MKTTYSTRYIHKISPKDSDVGPDVTVSAALLGSLTRNEAQLRLAKTLRAQGALERGRRLRNWRVDPEGRILAFPSGFDTYWHCIILTPKK